MITDPKRQWPAVSGAAPRSAVPCIAILVAVLSVSGCGSTAPKVSEAPTVRLQAFTPLEAIPIDPRRQSFTDEAGFAEYVIGPGDELEISLRDVDVTTETATVRPDGNISFSLVENVRADGLTPTELDSVLTVELARFLREPKVDVTVVNFKSKMVSLMGSILQSPTPGEKSGQGRYALSGKMTVLDLILQAGGSTPDALLDRVQLIRTGRSYQLNLRQVLSTGDQTHNVVLQGSDIVIVPGTETKSKKVIVLGEVHSPNVYMFAEDARILEALTQAGGVTGSALRDDIRLIRVVDGTPQMFSLNFARLTDLGDMQQNMALRTDDIIYVPRSFIGDINDVIAKVNPVLQFLLLPATYRDLYTTGGGLRVDTGAPTESEGGTIFTRPLPGTAAKPVAEGEQEGGDDESEGGDEDE